MTGLGVLTTPRAPWLLAAHDPARVARARAAVREWGAVVAVLDGSRMRTADRLHREFAAQLDFPDYYGHNWPALDDCLRDLAWRPGPGYLLVVEDAEQLLAGEPDERVGLLGDLLVAVARDWAGQGGAGQGWSGHPVRSPVPFHVVLACASREGQDALVTRWAGAGETLHPL